MRQTIHLFETPGSHGDEDNPIANQNKPILLPPPPRTRYLYFPLLCLKAVIISYSVTVIITVYILYKNAYA
jgi:hypothetical protein